MRHLLFFVIAGVMGESHPIACFELRRVFSYVGYQLSQENIVYLTILSKKTRRDDFMFSPRMSVWSGHKMS